MYKKYFVIFIAIALGIAERALAATTVIKQSALPPTINTTEEIPINTRNTESNAFANMCPNMLHYVFEGATPHDEAKAGLFEEYSTIDGDTTAEQDRNLGACVTACCDKDRNNTCNVVFAFKRKCYHLRCISNEACFPKERKQVSDRLQMILVNPVRQHGAEDENVTWLDVLKGTKYASDLVPTHETIRDGGSNRLSFWKQPRKYRFGARNQQDALSYDEDDFSDKRMQQMLLSPDIEDNQPFDEFNVFNLDTGPVPKYVTCDTELQHASCPGLKEECMPIPAHSTTGICKCQHGYVRNHLHQCVPREMDYPLMDESRAPTRTMLMAAASSDTVPVVAVDPQVKDEKSTEEPAKKSEPQKKLTVSVVSKEVVLPEKEVTLAAYTVPDEESSNSKYKYLWTLISQPKGPMNGTISDQSKQKVKLSNLSEGLYTFKVSVTGDNGTYGEAMANVSVLPEKRVNRVPQVVISPPQQIIRQPTSNAVLDGSTSTDDDKIISWHWEVVSGPIGYQPKLPDVPTLQLSDLKSPGNYTFKLTVSDSDNVTNSTTANISVLKSTDYPPVANAGDAVILYLPNNNVTLNGTASSDDHEIVAWEWTKDASDETKAVDMQNTRTPYVQLSNLEEGMYTFVLKVTDGSGQSSTAEVHVFVKPPTNSPPVAVAGPNVTINLPQNNVILNGSQSTDDIHIESYMWKQISGPNTAFLVKANETICNATALTLGLYQFQLSVTDGNNNTANDTLWVKVVQDKNAYPVANGGGDQSVTLPLAALYLNGSKSSDDLAVVNFTWNRDETSLAAGHIVGDTDKQPILILTDLVPGRYVFKLTVTDEQGLSNTDTVSVIVHPDPMLVNLVELTLPVSIAVLTQGELNSILQKIELLLNDMKVHRRDLKYDSRTESTILVFYAVSAGPETQSTPIAGIIVEQLLKKKLQRDASILGTQFSDVRTTICQNQCSDHGVCNTATRACICEAFWMPSISYYWGLDEANCDWSILYVFVGVIITLLLLSSVFWTIACACKQSKKPRHRPKLQKYSLIGAQDEETPHFRRATSLSDSETDSDVLFETRTKPNGILRSNGTSRSKHNHAQNKYAIPKMGRKIKT